jgi:hypothetical protein
MKRDIHVRLKSPSGSFTADMPGWLVHQKLCPLSTDPADSRFQQSEARIKLGVHTRQIRRCSVKVFF